MSEKRGVSKKTGTVTHPVVATSSVNLIHSVSSVSSFHMKMPVFAADIRVKRLFWPEITE